MKTIVTHLSPDLDAIAAVWLIKKYLPGWKNAIVKFVPAGTTLDNIAPDDNPEIIHVDTGLGKFDHHQSNQFTCASQLVYEYLIHQKHIGSKDANALERITELITEFDHFHECFYPDPTSDRYNVMINEIVEGLKKTVNNDLNVLDLTFKLLEATLINFKNKLSAEHELKKGYEFRSKWGKTLIVSTANSEVGKLAMKMGFNLVVTKNPDKGYVRIKTPPSKNNDLTPLYKKILKIDPNSTWFFHSSKRMLLNGTSKNPTMKATSLTIAQLIEIVKGV
ncbi:chromate resistance protein [Candidatus Roizmanbacteria bacterium]|nr:chromate resistance protein [Candidatus Roizmanbacteria bacterium]